jgi:hypothetical protein
MRQSTAGIGWRFRFQEYLLGHTLASCQSQTNLHRVDIFGFYDVERQGQGRFSAREIVLRSHFCHSKQYMEMHLFNVYIKWCAHQKKI